ncbi:hypothetical protein ACMGG3_10085 [Enterobacter sp. BNK-18]|uniref:hypothetical protein n=1 Tax=Enterobacter sp. BNK-18 TaxID=3376155 RepID=UPI0039BF4DEF
MSIITRERIENLLEFNSEGSDCQANAEQWEVHELARIALASFESEPVAWLRESALKNTHEGAWAPIIQMESDRMGADLTELLGVSYIPLYTAPPAPLSVPDELKEFLRLVECMLVDYRESNLGNAREWIRHISSASDAFEDAHSLSPWLWVRTARLAAMLQGAEPDFREISNSSTKHFRENAETSTKCWCQTCRPVTIDDMRFVVCPECGNKRCPHANDHKHACTKSNEPGQEGSAYPAAPQQEVKQ